jgi:flagellar biogenesis protein FliO
MFGNVCAKGCSRLDSPRLRIKTDFFAQFRGGGEDVTMRTRFSGAIPLLLGIAAVFLLPLAMAAIGGENGTFTPGQKEAFRQAMLNAEEELRDYGGDEDKTGAWSVSAILSLVALAIAVGFAAWMTRRLSGRRWVVVSAGKEMRIVERLPLGRQSALFIIEVGDRRYWVAEHPCGIAMLSECLPVRNPGCPPPPSKRPAPPESASASGKANPPPEVEADSGANGNTMCAG